MVVSALCASTALLTAQPAAAVPATVYVDTNTNGQFDPGETDNTFINGTGGATHNHAFDIPPSGNPTTGETIIDFDYIDNSFRLIINGTDICAPTVCQLQRNIFNAATQSFLQFTGGDFTAPWLASTTGLPRLRAIINATSVTLLGLRNRTDTALQPVIFTNGAPVVPGFTSGQNTITVINPDDNGPDGISGSITASYDPYNPSLSVTKTADRTVNVARGETVTYTYTVTNTGDAPIANVTLTDTHGGSNPPPVPGNEVLLTDNGIVGDSGNTIANDGVWDLLGPGDIIQFTAQYVVSQQDVDTLQ